MNKLLAISLSAVSLVVITVALVLPAMYGGSSDGTATTGGTGPGANVTASAGGGFKALPDSNPPKVSDGALRVEKVAAGLALPTSMLFLDENHVLVLQKENGKVREIVNGTLEKDPVLDVFVSHESERGLLGIASAPKGNSTSDRYVFLYFTETASGEVRNRIYRYDWSPESGFAGKKLILDLPGTPGPNHDGGKITVGPDGMLYAVIGDLNRNGMLQNYPKGEKPDDTSVILRINFSGDVPAGQVLSSETESINQSLAKYYSYGVRNSFGLDFDPLTGKLWDTENGPADYDEINIVSPGSNSGWEKVMGPIKRTNLHESDLVSLNGSHYRDPVFSWRAARGVTDIEFFNSSALGGKYANNIFVGDINNGNLYFFTLNGERDGLVLDPEGLKDLVSDDSSEDAAVTLGTGFMGITDIETGPDGYLYVLSYSGNLYRVVPDS